jgi:two-component system NtrC family sensor kinase
MRISLRKKITLTFCLFILVGGFIWFLNYQNHHHLQRTLQLVEKEDDLLNTILEARRYEKNFFLTLEYHHLLDALSFVRRGEQTIHDIMWEEADRLLVDNLDEKLEKIRGYRDALAALSDNYEAGVPKSGQGMLENLPEHEKKVREAGKRITIDVEQMVQKSRSHVGQLINESRAYHFGALAAMLCLCLFTALYLVFNVNRPLKSIEDAIVKIVRGDYENIPALSTGDEFESLVNSLNHMIEEFHKRSEQLVQSEKMVSLGTLTSGVAHELNNPLNNISTSVQILLEELQDGDLEYQKQLLTETENQIERARDIVKALLEFSRARSFSPHTVDFKEVVKQALKLISGEVPANVRISETVPSYIKAKMDPRRIQQVLINLIMNGCQAMEDGGDLHIVAWEDEDDEGFHFRVSDTGKGIRPKDLSKIFDPFFTTKDEGHRDVGHGHGSGLGLPVSQGIIEQHGGRIEAQSEEGKGTTFTVFLPKR